VSFEIKDDEAARPDPGPPAPPPLPPSDPRYWEERLGEGPATSALLRDREVAAAIRSGSPLAVHEALRKKLPSVTSPESRDSLAALLKNRRLFVEPIESPPGLTTVNGIGARLLGREEWNEEDGSYIATLWATLLFLPLWPIRPYLVVGGPRGGWHFLGRTPLSNHIRRWRLAVPAGLAAAVLVGAFLIWQRSTHDDVRFLNGLDFALSVQMGEKTIRLQPQASVTHEFSSGPYHVITRREDGSLVEELDVTVPGGTDVVVYNVLGAAPLYYERIPYLQDGVSPNRGDAYSRFLCLAGRSWFVRDDIDYVFEPNPERVEMESREKITSRTRIDLAEGGWIQSVQLLVDAGEMKTAAELSRTVALLQPRSETAVETALTVSELSGDVDATRAFLDQLIEKAPESIEAHRGYQTFHEFHGSRDELRERYKKRYDLDPVSAGAAYLYSRVAAPDVREPLLTKAVALHPKDPWLRRSLSWLYNQTARYEQAIPQYEKLLALDPEIAGGFAPYLARALAATGRHAQALDLVGRILAAAPARSRRGQDGLAGGHLWTLAALYESLLSHVPDGAMRPSVGARMAPILGRNPDAMMLAQIAALARDKPEFTKRSAGLDAGGDLTWARLTLLARDDLAAAAELARTCPPEALASLDDPARLAIACELDRLGRKARVEKLMDSLSLQARREVSRADIERLPETGGLNEDLDPLLRATLWYAAARRSKDADRRAELIAGARRFDPLGYVVPKEP